MVAVSEGRIPNGTDILYSSYGLLGDERVHGQVAGYIAQTDSYLVERGARLLAVPAERVVLPVPKFGSTEEADAWLEAQ